jgi:hypothetical protein
MYSICYMLLSVVAVALLGRSELSENDRAIGLNHLVRLEVTRYSYSRCTFIRRVEGFPELEYAPIWTARTYSRNRA